MSEINEEECLVDNQKEANLVDGKYFLNNGMTPGFEPLSFDAD